MSKFPDFPYLPAGFELEHELRDQLSNRPGNQRCVVGRDELLLVVHELPKAGVPEREPLLFWRRVDETWLDQAGGKGLRRLGELLERYERFLGEQGNGIGGTADEVFAVARAAGPVAKAARNLAVAIDQALNHDEDCRELRSLRDRAREIDRAAEQLHQDARLALEFRQALPGSGAGELLQRALLFLLPLILLRLVYGMNGGWLIPIVGLAAGAALVWLVRRNMGNDS